MACGWQIGSIDSRPKMDGKTLQMVIAPNKITAQKEKAAERKAQIQQNKSTSSSITDEAGEVEEEGEEDDNGDEGGDEEVGTDLPSEGLVGNVSGGKIEVEQL